MSVININLYASHIASVLWDMCISFVNIFVFSEMVSSDILCLSYNVRDWTYVVSLHAVDSSRTLYWYVLSYFRYLEVTCTTSCFSTCHIIYLYVEASGFIIFLGVIWILQETTQVRILRYAILFIGNILQCHLLLNILWSHVECHSLVGTKSLST